MTSDGTDDLVEMARALVERAGPGEQVEVLLSRASSTSVRVYGGEVESLTSADSSGAGIRVIRDGRLGFAHCGSLDPTVLAETLVEARDNAAFGEPDEFNGLAEPDGVAVVERDAWSDLVLAQPTDTKVEMALELERRVMDLDPRVVGARTTAYGDAWGESVIVSTAGVERSDRGASCSIATQPLAREGEETQTGFGHDAGRDPGALDLDRVAAEAVERATRLLGATKPASGRMTILLEPRLALTLLGIVSGMVCADAVQRGRTPFGDRLDQLRGTEGLGQESIRTGPLAGLAVLGLRAGRQQHDGRVPQLGVGLELFTHLKAVQLTRHHHIQQHQVRPQPTRRLQPRRPVHGLVDLVVLGFERPADQAPDVGLVFDDQQSAHVSSRDSSCGTSTVDRGSHNVTAVPSPGWLARASRPPSSSTISFTMLMPSPVPGMLPEASAR